MALTMTVVFRGDDLIGQDPRVATWGVHLFRGAETMSRALSLVDCYTVVSVCLETELQCYTSIAIQRYWVSHETNVGWCPRTSQLPLSGSQARVLSEWLIKHNSLAWENAAADVKNMLDVRGSSGGHAELRAGPSRPHVGQDLTTQSSA